MFNNIVAAVGDTSGPDLHTQANLLRTTSGTVEDFHAGASNPRAALDELLTHVISRNADLLVVGARRHHLAQRAAMLAPCSVLMVPDGAALSLDRLLVPVDFSETSELALREAARIASHAGSSVTVVAVESDEDPWLDWKDYPERYQQELDEFVNRVSGPGHGFDCLVEPEHRLDPGEPAGSGLDGFEGARTAASILDVAERLGSTLIVAGTRGRTQAAAIFLGSVVEKIIHHSPVPVLAVKRPGHQLGLLEGLLQQLAGDRQLVAS